jgi:hypothetical protein
MTCELTISVNSGAAFVLKEIHQRLLTEDEEGKSPLYLLYLGILKYWVTGAFADKVYHKRPPCVSQPTRSLVQI